MFIAFWEEIVGVGFFKINVRKRSQTELFAPTCHCSYIHPKRLQARARVCVCNPPARLEKPLPWQINGARSICSHSGITPARASRSAVSTRPLVSLRITSSTQHWTSLFCRFQNKIRSHGQIDWATLCQNLATFILKLSSPRFLGGLWPLKTSVIDPV